MGYLNLWDIFKFLFTQLRMSFFHKIVVTENFFFFKCITQYIYIHICLMYLHNYPSICLSVYLSIYKIYHYIPWRDYPILGEERTRARKRF